jgi:hypothetical protein
MLPAGGGDSAPPTSILEPNKRGAPDDSLAMPMPKKINPNNIMDCDVSENKEKRIKYEYNSNFLPPYIVHVQKKIDESSVNINPVVFGMFLHKNKINEKHNIDKIKSIGRQKISIQFLSYLSANNFMNEEVLKSNNYIAFVPSFLATRMGVIRRIPTDISDKDLIDNLVIPSGVGKIAKVRRMKYKKKVGESEEWHDSQTVVVTFEGQVLPPHLYLFYNRIPVETYILPTVQCYRCSFFGHTKIQCRGKIRCYNCGGEHTGDKCTIDLDSAVCCNCGGNHSAVSVTCPEFLRQKNIKRLMAEDTLSYFEASKKIPKIAGSYATKLSNSKINNSVNISPPQSPTMTRKWMKISQLPHQSTPKPRKESFINLRDKLKEMDKFLIAPNGNLPQPENGCVLKGNSSLNCDVKESLKSEDIFSTVNVLIKLLTNLLSAGNFVSSPNCDNSIKKQLDNIISVQQKLDLPIEGSVQIISDSQSDNSQ